MPEPNERYDVVVLGGGLASLSLSRLLSLTVPQASVLTVDSAVGPVRKVGETTTEIGAQFLHDRLRMGQVMATTQLPKNGLRSWFDDETNSLAFHEASEDGPATFAWWRAYQLERETLEQSILELDAAEAPSVTHLFGVKGVSAEPGAGGARHTVRFELDGAAREVEATWLVDATGIRSLLGRQLGNLQREERLTHSACWTWFEGGINSIDELMKQPAARRRVNLGPRALATNLLLNEGYWIYLIPLASGAFSVGLVYDHTILTEPPGNLEQLVAFLRRHRMARDLLGDAQADGFGVLKNFSFRPERLITEDRVAWIGTSAGFIDPFYGSGIDWIGLTAEYLGDLIRRDLGGEGIEPERLEAGNRGVKLFYEQSLQFVAGMYRSLASHELSSIRLRRDTHVYWNLYAWPYFSQQCTDLDFHRAWRPLAEEALERGGFFSRVVRYACDRLCERGKLRRDNKGKHTFNHLGFRNLPYIRFEQHLGTKPDLERCRHVLAEIDAGSFLALLDVIFDGDRSPNRALLFEVAFEELFQGEAFARLLELEARSGGLGDAFFAAVFRQLGQAIVAKLADEVDLSGFSLSAANYRRLLPELAGRCADPEQEKRVRKRVLSSPDLMDFADLTPNRPQVQPIASWSVDHTPWLDAPPTFQSVYEVLGPTWWRDPQRPLSTVLRPG